MVNAEIAGPKIDSLLNRLEVYGGVKIGKFALHLWTDGEGAVVYDKVSRAGEPAPEGSDERARSAHPEAEYSGTLDPGTAEALEQATAAIIIESL